MRKTSFPDGKNHRREVDLAPELLPMYRMQQTTFVSNFNIFQNKIIDLHYFRVDNFESHEGTLYCKPHFKALFAPKVVEDDVPGRCSQS